MKVLRFDDKTVLQMNIKEKFEKVLAIFETNEQNPETELHYSNTFELLIAVSLSAQCTDKRVNMHTPAIFRDFPEPVLLAKATEEQLFPYIQSISFPNNKTRNLIAMGKVLVEKFNSKVPETIEELVTIPGVGRKTANVIVSVVYGKAAMAVDTHVFRVSKRVGLVKDSLKTPFEVEKALVKYIPEDKIARAHHWLILHGRYTCTARSPKCDQCAIVQYCDFFKKVKKKDFTPISGKTRKVSKTSAT